MTQSQRYEPILQPNQPAEDCPNCKAKISVFTFQEKFIDMKGEYMSYDYRECFCCDYSTKSSSFGNFLNDQFSDIP